MNNNIFYVNNICYIDFGNACVYVDDKKVASITGKKLYKMLFYFCNNCNKIVTRNQIIEYVWDADENDTSSDENFNTYILRIRKLHTIIGESLKTIKNIGYKFEINVNKNDVDSIIKSFKSEEFVEQEENSIVKQITYPIYPNSIVISKEYNEYETYCERSKALEAIKSVFEKYKTQEGIVIIGGMAGLGKTELARAYAYNNFDVQKSKRDYSNKYSYELFLTYTSFDDLKKDIQSNINFIQSENSLVIIDNFDLDNNLSLEHFIDVIKSMIINTDLIITTRCKIVSGKYSKAYIDLSDFANEDICLSIFKKNYELQNMYGNKLELTDQEEVYLQSIFRMYGNNVLFSKLLAIQLRENDGEITIEDYYNNFNMNSDLKENLSAGVEIDDFEHNGSLYSSGPYMIIKDIVFGKRFKINYYTQDDIKVLFILSLNSPSRMERGVLCDICGISTIEFKSIHNKLVRLGLIEFYVDYDDLNKRYLYGIHSLTASVFLDCYNSVVTFNNNGCIDELLRGVISLDIRVLLRQRFVFEKIIDRCIDTELKKIYQIVYSLVFKRRDVKDSDMSDIDISNNVIPYIEYDSNYVRYSFYDVAKCSEGKELIKINTVNRKKITPHISLLKPFLDGKIVEIIIPNEINGKKIYEIPDYWLFEYDMKCHIRFPESLIRIGKNAFKGCGLSGELRLPNNLNFIDDDAFSGCANITGILYLPDSVSLIGERCFCDCIKIIKVVFSKSIKEISWGSFGGCRMLESVVFPNSLVSISGYSFGLCEKIKKLCIPASVERIDKMAFAGCHNITEVIIDNNSSVNIGEKAFSNCYKLLDKYEGKFNEYIGSFDELNFDDELELTIPNDVKIIKTGIFTRKYNTIGKLIIPDSVEEIEEYAFDCCSKIKGYIRLPDQIKKIGKGAFRDCSSLEGNLQIPFSMTRIEEDTFQGCSGLDGQLSFPSNLEYIGDYSFNMCINLKGDLIIPDRVKYIGPLAFAFCKSLGGRLGLPGDIDRIYHMSFCDCTSLKGTLNIPNKVSVIEDGAFMGCSGLTGEIIIPEMLSYLGANAFDGCNFSGDIVFQKELKHVGGHALDNNSFKEIVFLNPQTEFPNERIINNENVVIKGYKYSTAEYYSSVFGYQFEYL